MTSLSDFNDSQKEVLENMQKAYNPNKRLIPFVGAGFSKNITGYPDWTDFIKQLGEKISCDLNALFKNNNLEACEYFIWEKAEILEKADILSENDDHFTEGKKKLLDFIKQIATNNERNSNNNQEWALHDKLVSKFDYIYTTNWDNTLEQAVPNPHKEVKPFFTQIHLSDVEYGKNSIQVIKLHGSYQDIDAESLIACQRDYNQRIIKENPFDIKFKNDLLHNNFFFIGYNFGDPNILLMIDLIQQMTQYIPQKKKVDLFWLSTEPFRDQRVELLKKSMKVKTYHLLTADQQESLDNLKQKLKQKCDKCVVKKNTGMHNAILFDLCENCPELERSRFMNEKSKFIKEETKAFLDKF